MIAGVVLFLDHPEVSFIPRIHQQTLRRLALARPIATHLWYWTIQPLPPHCSLSLSSYVSYIIIRYPQQASLPSKALIGVWVWVLLLRSFGPSLSFGVMSCASSLLSVAYVKGVKTIHNARNINTIFSCVQKFLFPDASGQYMQAYGDAAKYDPRCAYC